MRRAEAIRLVEELTYQLEALRKENAGLKEQLRERYVKVGNLIKDNGRLLNINSYLAHVAGQQPQRRRYDENGDYIPKDKEEKK